MKTQLNPLFFLSALVCSLSSHAQPKLQEVIVTSSRMDTPVRQVGAAVSVVDREEITLRGYSSMADLLRTQPGVAVTNTGGSGKATALRIRGEEGYRTMVMIDGIDVADPTGTQVGPQVQHLSVGGEIEKIEILRGPQGFIYGADAGGVINILTRKADGLASELSFETGRYNTFNGQGFIAMGNDRVDAFVSVNHQSTDGFNARVDDSSLEPDGYNNTTLHGRFDGRVSDLWEAQLVMRSTDATSEYDNCGSNDCLNEFAQDIAKLSFAYEGAAYSHSMGVAYTATDRGNVGNGQSTFSADGSTAKLEYVGTAVVNPAFTLVWGGDAEDHKITANSGERSNRTQAGLFSEAQMNVEQTFYLSVGARFDDDQDFGDYLSARIAPAFVQQLRSGSSIKYRASWGTGFRAPSLSEISYNRRPGVFSPAAEVVLVEETSEGVDVGVEFYSASGSSVQLGYFDQKIENEMYFDMQNFSGYLQGRGISHSRGGELAFELPMLSFLTLGGNYTYNDTLTGDDQVRARRPRHLANITLLISALEDQLKASVNLRTTRDSVNSDSQATPLDNYQVMDVSTQYQAFSSLTLLARVENALNEQYQEVVDYNTSGRAFYAGVKYAF